MRIKKVALSERNVYEPKMSEEDVLSQIRQMLEINGARVFRLVERVPKCYRCGCWLGVSERSLPDLTGYFHKDGAITMPFWFEVKKRKGVRRPGQVAWMEQYRSEGGCGAIVESWDEVRQELERKGLEVKVQ